MRAIRNLANVRTRRAEANGLGIERAADSSLARSQCEGSCVLNDTCSPRRSVPEVQMQPRMAAAARMLVFI
jgi:hypothetical protein